MTKNIFFLIVFILVQVLCQAQLPSTDIWLMQINFKHGNIQLTEPKNITHKKGYENQPSYSKDGKVIYYTGQSDTSAKTAIYSYTLSTRETKQATFSATSPYSPMPSPTENGISTVTVEKDSTQRIWLHPFSGADPYPLFPKRDSVGYYAWINAQSALAFILPGKNTSNRLSLINADGTEKKIAENVGRGMKVFGKGAFFIQKKDSIYYLSWTNFDQTKPLVKTPGSSVDLAVYKDYVLMASEGIIYAAKMKMKKGQVVSFEEFKPLEDLSSFGLKNISRMAVSPDEKTIAIATGM